MKARGEIATGTLVVIAILAVAVGMFSPKPKMFDGRSRDADKSEKASAGVEKRIVEADTIAEKTGAVVSASVQQISVAAGQLPDGPQKSFIQREAAWVSPLLPPPDAQALLAAERRRIAILEGKLDVADKLYAKATKENEVLLERAAKAEERLNAALRDRREVDGRLSEAAAYARGQEHIIGILCGIALLAFAGWVFAKLNGLSTKTVGAMLSDIRSGDNPQEVFDRYVPVRLWKSVRHAASDSSVKNT